MTERTQRWAAESAATRALGEQRQSLVALGRAVMEIPEPEGGWPEPLASRLAEAKLATTILKNATDALYKRDGRW